MAVDDDSAPTVIVESDDSITLQETVEATTVVVEESSNFIIEIEPERIIIEDKELETFEIIEPGPQGIRGPAPDHRWVGTSLQIKNPDGSWGEAADLGDIDTVKYAKQTDFIDDDHWYEGEAVPGSATNSSIWRINYNVLNAEGDLSKTWADTANFSQVWDDRLTLIYT